MQEKDCDKSKKINIGISMKKLSFLLLFSLAISPSFGVEPPDSDHRTGRAEFVASLIKPGDIGAEIGVCMGVFAYHVLVPSKPAQLFLIDPWQYGLQADMEKEITERNQLARDAQYRYVCEIFKDFSNVRIIRSKSEDAVAEFEDNFFDYVYIDGEHSYAAVTRDLNNYFQKVKVGGYIIGDDYGWTGIADAVQDFLKSHEQDCWFGEDPYLGRTGGQFVIQRIR
jgi:hypothetical protein